MAKLTIGFEGGTGRLEIEGQGNDIRNFVSSYERFLGGDAKVPRRFLFRREGSTATTGIVIDMTKVNWVSVDDTRTPKEGDQATLAKPARRTAVGQSRR